MKIGINSSFIVTHFDDLLQPNFFIDKINSKNLNSKDSFLTFDFYRLKFETNLLNYYDLGENIIKFLKNTENELNYLDFNLSDKKYYELDVNFNNIEENLLNAYEFDKKIKTYNFVITNGFIKIYDEVFKDDNYVKIFIYLLDLFLGTSSLFFDNDASQIIRRLFYKCGDYSKHQNVVEYKLLSNDWLFDINKINFVYEVVEFCLSFIKDESFKKFYEIENNFVYIHGYDFIEFNNIINQLKTNKAERYLRFIMNFLPENICKDLEKIKTP